MNSKEYGQNMTLKQSKLDHFSGIIYLVRTRQAEQGVFFESGCLVTDVCWFQGKDKAPRCGDFAETDSATTWFWQVMPSPSGLQGGFHLIFFLTAR